LENAIDAVYRDEDELTPDQGGVASTTEFCEAVAKRL
jgi:isocitrate/isopropylmalate dehydrogenase